MATLPARDSPLWKEAVSDPSIKPFHVRAMPRQSGTLIDKIYGNSEFWIIPTITETTDFIWVAVKTVSVVGWCASPPLTYTLVPTEPPPPLPDDDTEQLPTIPDGLFSAWLSNTELQQAIVLHTQIAIANNEIAALYQAALDRGKGT